MEGLGDRGGSMHQTTFLWLKSDPYGVYFYLCDQIELIVFTTIGLITIFISLLLFIVGEKQKALKQFLVGSLAVILPIVFSNESHHVMLEPIRNILWYHGTHGAAVVVILCLIPLFIFVPYTAYMTIVALKKIIKNRRHNKN